MGLADDLAGLPDTPGGFVRIGVVSLVDYSVVPTLFTVKPGRKMPSVGLAPSVGDKVVWLDIPDPVLLGKIGGVDIGGLGGVSSSSNPNSNDLGLVADSPAAAGANTAKINSAIATNATGSVLSLPQGRYYVASTIQVRRNGLVIQGQGWSDRDTTVSNMEGTVLIAADGFVGSSVVDYSSPNSDNRPLLGSGMRDMMVVGPAMLDTSGTPAQAHCINGRVARGIWDRVYVTDATNHGILVEGATVADDGLYWATYDTYLNNCQASHNQGDGVHLSAKSGDDVHVSKLVSFSNGGNGLVSAGASNHIGQIHLYGNSESGMVLANVRTKISGPSKIEENDKHGLHCKSLTADGSHIGGMLLSGVGFKNNSKAGNGVYSDVHFEVEHSDGPWSVTGCDFGWAGANSPKYGIDAGSSNLNSGLVLGNTFGAGTFTVGPINDGGPSSGAYRNRIGLNQGIE